MKNYSLAFLSLAAVLAVAPAARADNLTFTFISTPNPNGSYVYATGIIGFVPDQGYPPSNPPVYDAQPDYIDITSNIAPVTGLVFGQSGTVGYITVGTSPAGPTITWVGSSGET
jgi:hypothetical protein